MLRAGVEQGEIAMIQINLLPWREQARKEKKLRFAITLGGFVGLTLFLVVLLHLYFYSLIRYQKNNNIFLETELKQEQLAIGTFNKKKKEQAEIDTHLRFIFTLRNKGYKATAVLDELAQIVPEAILLNKIIREGNMIFISGKAESNLQVTLFMENISQSRIFKQPVLTEITGKGSSSGEERYFQLKVEQQE